ncbi:MAG: 50S ribosomal protein L6, partial [Candidatus Diapherotrites archaeon]|nr:50S ribosomal protein L6 [Candidatus Diapherotrites archaeon]
NDSIVIKTDSRAKEEGAIVGTFAAIILNLFKGVQKGYESKLSIVYSHFPLTVAKKDKILEVSNFLGGKKVIKSKIFGKDTVVEVKGKEILVKGHDKELVSLTAASLERSIKVKNKDRRVFQDGIYITQKAVLVQ